MLEEKDIYYGLQIVVHLENPINSIINPWQQYEKL